MSKRHQANRRRSYGRRQHELAERRPQEAQSDPVERALDEADTAVFGDRFAFFDAGTRRLQFALGD
jgi:hypothetical protein